VYTIRFNAFVVGDEGHPFATQEQTIHVNPTVTVNSPVICASIGSAVITATPSPAGIYSYAWTVPQGATDPGNVASFTASVAGTYKVVISVESVCTATASGTLIINPLPTATISGTQSICYNGSATLSVALTGAMPWKYQWSDDNGATTHEVIASTSPSTFDVSPEGNKTYTIVSVTDGNGCTNTGTGAANVYQGPITTAPAITACANTRIEVPVMVKSFSEVGAISLSLKYNHNVMTFNGFESGGVTFGAINVSDNNVDGVYHKINISTTSSTALPTLENKVLLTLKFNYIGGNTDLVWTNEEDNLSCEYSYLDPTVPSYEQPAFCDNPSNHYYINGSVVENTYLKDYIGGLDLTLDETFNYSSACIASGDAISSISGTGSLVALFNQMNNLPAGIKVVKIASYNLTGNQANDMAGVKAALIVLMEAANLANNTVGGLDGLTIHVPVTYGNITYTGCEQTAVFAITYNTAVPEAQQAMEDYVAAQQTTASETFAYVPSCIASGDLISSISGTGTMVALINGLPTTVNVVSIAGYTMTGVPATDMAGISSKLNALMVAQTTNGTVGELNGKHITFDVVYANKLNALCTQTQAYTITYNTDTPDAQQAMEEYVAGLITNRTEDFAGLCLEGTNQISTISGTGKMVELFSQIAALQSGGQINVVSVAGVAYNGSPANKAVIAAAIKNLMLADGRTTISELNGVTITIPVVFANALNSGCTSLVNFGFTFDTSIPDHPLAISCSPIVVNNDPNVCGASVTFAAAVTGVPTPRAVVYKIGTVVISSPYNFPVGTTTVTATVSNACKEVSCTFDVTVNDNQKPVITLEGDAIVSVCQNSTYSDAGATATDNCLGTLSIVTVNPVNVNVADTYTITYNVKDAANNDAIQVTRTVIVIPLPTVDVTPANAACNGALDGSITFTPGDLTRAYSYTLEPGGHTRVNQTGAYTFNGLAANTYTWTMTDVATNCSTSGSVIVEEPDPIKLSGYIKYYNSVSTPLQNLTVELKQSGITKYTSGNTDASGYYEFPNVCTGTYDVVITTRKDILGINSTDAGQVNAWGVAGVATDVWPGIEKVRFLSADVDGDLYVDAGDAAMIQKYFVTAGTGTTFDKNWEFWKVNDELVTTQPQGSSIPQIVINGNESITQNFLGMVSGEFKHRYVPTGDQINKLASISDTGNLTLQQGTNVPVTSNATIDLPVKAVSSMQVGAISLILDYPVDKLQVESVFLQNNPDQPVMFNTINGVLRIGWNSLSPISLAKGEPMLTVRLKTAPGLAEGEVCRFELSRNPLNELADGAFDVIQNAALLINGMELKKDVTAGIDIADRPSVILMSCYPNPFSENATIKYTLPETGHVNIEVTSILGNRIRLLSDQQQTAGKYMIDLDGNNIVPGVYQVTLRFKNQFGKEYSQTIRMIKR
jgi:hypothetical protein